MGLHFVFCNKPFAYLAVPPWRCSFGTVKLVIQPLLSFQLFYFFCCFFRYQLLLDLPSKLPAIRGKDFFTCLDVFRCNHLQKVLFGSSTFVKSTSAPPHFNHGCRAPKLSHEACIAQRATCQCTWRVDQDGKIGIAGSVKREYALSWPLVMLRVWSVFSLGYDAAGTRCD